MSSLLTGLKAYYKMEGNGTDSSGGGNNATPLNVSFSNANGKILQGGGFNGSTSKFTKNASSMLTGTNATSVAGWIKVLGGGFFPVAISLGSTNDTVTNSSFAFYLESNGTMNLGTYINVVSGAFINDGNWHFCVATYNGGTVVKFYVDNILTGTGSFTMNFLDSNIRIGYLDTNNSPVDPDQNFTGNVDEVGYWQRELSVSEINTLWNSGNGLSYPFGATNAGLLFNLL